MGTFHLHQLKKLLTFQIYNIERDRHTDGGSNGWMEGAMDGWMEG